MPDEKPKVAVDHAKLFAEKSAEFIEKYKGKEGHNPFLFLLKFDDVKASIAKKLTLSQEQCARISAEWPAPTV